MEVYDSSQIIANFTKISQISPNPAEFLLNESEIFERILLPFYSSTRNLEERRFYLLEQTKQAKQPRSTWENTVLGKNYFEREHRGKGDQKLFCNVSSRTFLCLLLNNTHFVK